MGNAKAGEYTTQIAHRLARPPKVYIFEGTTDSTDSTTKVACGELPYDGVILNVQVQALELIGADADNAVDAFVGTVQVYDGTVGADLAAYEMQAGSTLAYHADVSTEGTVQIATVNNTEAVIRGKKFRVYVTYLEDNV